MNCEEYVIETLQALQDQCEKLKKENEQLKSNGRLIQLREGRIDYYEIDDCASYYYNEILKKNNLTPQDAHLAYENTGMLEKFCQLFANSYCRIGEINLRRANYSLVYNEQVYVVSVNDSDTSPLTFTKIDNTTTFYDRESAKDKLFEIVRQNLETYFRDYERNFSGENK